MIILDMDGVLTDFVKAALPLFGKDIDYPITKTNMEEALGITTNEFWGAIEKAGHDWWANMPETLECDEILNLCQHFVISTSPLMSVHAVTGKIEWLRKKFGSKFNNYMVGKQKQLMSKPGNILIDDFETNVNKFRSVSNPGDAILVPRPWNKGRDLNLRGMQLVKYIKHELRIIEKSKYGIG